MGARKSLWILAFLTVIAMLVSTAVCWEEEDYGQDLEDFDSEDDFKTRGLDKDDFDLEDLQGRTQQVRKRWWGTRVIVGRHIVVQSWRRRRSVGGLTNEIKETDNFSIDPIKKIVMDAVVRDTGKELTVSDYNTSGKTLRLIEDSKVENYQESKATVDENDVGSSIAKLCNSKRFKMIWMDQIEKTQKREQLEQVDNAAGSDEIGRFFDERNQDPSQGCRKWICTNACRNYVSNGRVRQCCRKYCRWVQC